jgi:hypothetical protein
MVLLLLMFLSPPLRGEGPMALMLGHEWQHIYSSSLSESLFYCG